jgi:ATP/ADP translocase
MSDKPPAKATSATMNLNLSDIGDVSPEQVVIILIVLKKSNITEAELWDEVLKSAPNKRMDRQTFEKALGELVKNKWLWKMGEGETAVYSEELHHHNSRPHLHMGMRKPGSIFTSTWQMLDAKETMEIEREKAATPAEPRIITRAKSIAGWFTGARQILILMLVLSAINFFAVASIDVTGVSGFVETVGTKNLPWISIAEMLLGLAVSAIYIQYADRVPSLRLMKIMIGILVGVYAITAGLFFAAKYTHLLDGLATIFNLKETTALLYPLLYLMRSQQIIVFPIAFWNLANRLYTMANARQAFPVIASGEMIGGLIGYTLFTEIFGRAAVVTKDNAFELLVLCGLLFLFILVVVQLTMKEPEGHNDNARQGESVLQNFKDGIDIIRGVPLFRYLAITIALVWMSLPILEYHFYTSIDGMSGTQSGSFENFYSLYNIGLTLLPLLLQWRIVPALTKRVEIRNAFIVLPVALVIGSLLMNLISGVYLVAVVLLVGFTIYASWDSPMTNTLQYLVPEDRRGRVGALLNNYAYAFGKILGSLFLGLILSAGLTGNTNSNLYLTLALVAAFGSLGTAILVRLTYDNSMLSWRIARRARSSSVFDKLDGL